MAFDFFTVDSRFLRTFSVLFAIALASPTDRHPRPDSKPQRGLGHPAGEKLYGVKPFGHSATKQVWISAVQVSHGTIIESGPMNGVWSVPWLRGDRGAQRGAEPTRVVELESVIHHALRC